VFYLLGKKTLSNTALLATYFMLVPCLVYSSTLKMEVTYSFEMSIDSQGVIFKNRNSSAVKLYSNEWRKCLKTKLNFVP
jgi:hypothetical protein